MKASGFLVVILVLIHLNVVVGFLFASHTAVIRQAHSKYVGLTLLGPSGLRRHQRIKGTARYSMIFDTLIQRVIVKNFAAWRSALTQMAPTTLTVSGFLGLMFTIVPNFFYVVELVVLGFMIYAAVLAVSPLFYPILWSGGDYDVPPIRGKR
jgi:hypothetical protein